MQTTKDQPFLTLLMLTSGLMQLMATAETGIHHP